MVTYYVGLMNDPTPMVPPGGDGFADLWGPGVGICHKAVFVEFNRF